MSGLAAWPTTAIAQVQPLSLAEALATTRSSGFAVRMAAAESEAARAGERSTLATVLPTVRADAGALRTTDPVGVFGLRLRQRELAPTDFDPTRLTHPAARSAMIGGVDLLIPLYSPEQRWARRAAKANTVAATASESRMRQLAEGEAARAWLGVLGAAEQSRALDAALAAARAATTQAAAFLRAGTATRADVLLAEVRVNELLQLRTAAHEQQRMTRLNLALAIGTPDDTIRSVTPITVSTDSLLGELGASVGGGDAFAWPRADVAAAQARHAAADANRALAARALVPRLHGMVRREWNGRTDLGPAAPYTTAGVTLQWVAFGGGAEQGARQAASAHATAARVAADAAAATARLEISRAHGALTVTAERLRLAVQAAAQATEAERLVRLRYAGGLATIAELLGASATRTNADVQLAATRLDALNALVAHRLSAGQDLAPLLRLTQ